MYWVCTKPRHLHDKCASFTSKHYPTINCLTSYKHFFCLFHRREHARNKQQLESLIAEVDQMARDVDPSLLLSTSKRQEQVCMYNVCATACTINSNNTCTIIRIFVCVPKKRWPSTLELVVHNFFVGGLYNLFEVSLSQLIWLRNLWSWGPLSLPQICSHFWSFVHKKPRYYANNFPV